MVTTTPAGQSDIKSDCARGVSVMYRIREMRCPVRPVFSASAVLARLTCQRDYYGYEPKYRENNWNEIRTDETDQTHNHLQLPLIHILTHYDLFVKHIIPLTIFTTDTEYNLVLV